MLYHIDKEGIKRYAVEHMEVKDNGYVLLVLFIGNGSREGLVGVPEKNILHGVGWQGYVEDALKVHGGITLAMRLKEMTRNLWFFGFDTEHDGDAPDFENMKKYGFEHNIALEKEYFRGGQVRTFEYVWGEVTNLYNQLIKYEEE